MLLELPRQTFEKYSNNFTKIRPVGAELFHADRQTDITMKLIVAFRNFANAPKNSPF